MREFAYLPYSVHEGPGRDRADAIARMFAFMDAHSKGRRLPAAERYVVRKVYREGEGWWRIIYGPKVRAS